MLQILLAAALGWPLSLFAQDSTSAFDWDEAKSRCLVHHEQSPELFMGTFSWGYSLLEMEDKFNEVYDSGERIYLHANYSPEDDTFYAWYEDKPLRPVRLSEKFVKSVTLQIETALEKGFADYVFFPDMGHSHLYFPEEHWKNVYGEADTSNPNAHNHYANMFDDAEMRPLYHLAEQLQMIDENKALLEDETLQFRYWHRNFVGRNDQTKDFSIEVVPASQNYNTVSSIDGYHSWSAGFDVSASKDGCFPYRDKDGVKRYFDISLKDPRYDPNSSSGWDM